MATSMLGFDIGAAQLKIVYWDGETVKKMIEADMPDNMIRNETIISYDAMADLIRETVREAKLKENKAAVILPSQIAFLRRVTVPYMSREQLMYNLPYEFRDFLNDAKDKYVYDYLVNKTINDEEGKPKELDVFASSVSKEIMMQYREMFRRAGLKLEIAIPRESAYINLIRKSKAEEGKEIGFLDLGHTSTRLDIFTGETFETTRNIDLGLQDVDAAIADAEKVDEHIARTYKVSNYRECQECEGAKKIYESIAADLRKAVNFYGFSNRESNLKDVFICGGGANIAPLVKAVGDALDDIHLIRIQDTQTRFEDQNVDSSAFVAAIGAAIQTKKPGDNNINLAKEERKKLPLGKTIAGIVIVLAVCAAFTKFLVTDRFAQADELTRQAQEVEAKHSELAEYVEDYNDIAVKYDKYSVTWMNETEQARVNRERILQIIDEVLKDRCMIDSISITENTAAVEVSECTLEEVSRLVDKILNRDDVADVVMRSALKDEETGDLRRAVIEFTMKNAEEIE